MTNASRYVEGIEDLTDDDAAWALTCAFLILTMQTGFAMLECGCVSLKNATNIMIKNVVDVSVGGISYWIFGYALSFGYPSNWFCGYGKFFFNAVERGDRNHGTEYSRYFFQFSFATTATTIVSGAVAERMKLHAYMLFSFLSSIIYCIPCGWAWRKSDGFTAGSVAGWLYDFGFYDFAGVGVVHVNGGVSALVATLMIGPRRGRFRPGSKITEIPMHSPITSLAGVFMLWWAWLGFNCGSTFGVSGDLWKITAIVAVTTLNGGIGGGLVGLTMSMVENQGRVLVDYIIMTVLGGLVSVTGIASVTTPAEAVIIGSVGGLIAVITHNFLNRLRIDDPVSAVPVHFGAATWGLLSIGLFAQDNHVGQLRGASGLFHGGALSLIKCQIVGWLAIAIWSAVVSAILLFCIDAVIGLRVSPEDEYLGADYIEHSIHPAQYENRLRKAIAAISKDGAAVERVDMLLNRISQNNTRNNSEVSLIPTRGKWVSDLESSNGYV